MRPIARWLRRLVLPVGLLVLPTAYVAAQIIPVAFWVQMDEALEDVGAAFSWGQNMISGLAGIGTLPEVHSPGPVVSPSVVTWTQVSAGASHSCGVDADGRAYCWGSAANGRIGYGGTNATNPWPLRLVSPTGVSWTQISAGTSHSCGVDTDGRAYCWGAGNSGQLGYGSTNATNAWPLRVVSSTQISWTQVSASGSHSCGVDTNGRAYCWGVGSNGQLGYGGTLAANARPLQVVSPTGISWTQVSAGNAHSCGVDTDGRAYCWGAGNSGQLGYGSTSITQPWTLRVVSSSQISWTQVSAGTSHSCGVDTNGRAYCWGAGTSGRLGYGGTNASNPWPLRLVSPTGVSWTQISAGSHSCGVDTNGRAYCWGAGSNGELGFGSTNLSNPWPLRVVSSTQISWTQVSVAGSHSCGVDTNGQTHCWGNSGDAGTLGNGDLVVNGAPRSMTSPTSVDWTQVSAGTSHSCGVDTNGRAYCWGNGNFGSLGYGGSNSSNLWPLRVVSGTQISWTQVSAAGSHSCGVGTDGRAYCWGSGTSGQLGYGGTNSSILWPLRVVSNSQISWTQVSVGTSHSCGVDTDGRAYCWGFGSSGQLGYGGTNATNAWPLRVVSSTQISWTQVSASGSHSCGVDTDGHAYCWGVGSNGQMGYGGTNATNAWPLRVVSSTQISWTQVSAGNSFSCGVDTSGRAYCWGAGNSGQLGFGSTNLSNPWPLRVVSSTQISWTQVSAGNAHSCGLDTNGRAYCWGDGAVGQVGSGQGNLSSLNPWPLRVGGSNISWTAISAGATATLGIGTVTP
jgi:alpha-tubulin suppressor-like RCC1 family protein